LELLDACFGLEAARATMAAIGQERSLTCVAGFVHLNLQDESAMTLVELLGMRLKDDAVLQFFDDHQVGDVIYEFDRLHDGTDDKYRANAKALGFEIVFNQDQELETVFCYASPTEAFASVDPAVAGVPMFSSPVEAEIAAMTAGHRCTKGAADIPVLGLNTSWVRHERAGVWVHYEFRHSALALVTLSRPKS
jgi:hypothetical protein